MKENERHIIDNNPTKSHHESSSEMVSFRDKKVVGLFLISYYILRPSEL